MANVLCDEKRLSVLAALCDGNSIRAAKEDEPTNEPSKVDIDRLALLGWTRVAT